LQVDFAFDYAASLHGRHVDGRPLVLVSAATVHGDKFAGGGREDDLRQSLQQRGGLDLIPLVRPLGTGINLHEPIAGAIEFLNLWRRDRIDIRRVGLLDIGLQRLHDRLDRFWLWPQDGGRVWIDDRLLLRRKSDFDLDQRLGFATHQDNNDCNGQTG